MTLVLLMTAVTGAWGMQVYIFYPSWPTGTTSVNSDGNLMLEMEPSDSFDNMKAKIQDKTGFDPTYMHLYYNSTELLDNETLYEKGIQNQYVLTLAYTPDKHLISVSSEINKKMRSMEKALPYETTIGEIYEAVTGEQGSNLDLIYTFEGVSSSNTDAVSAGDFNGWNTPVMVKADGEAAVTLQFSMYFSIQLNFIVVPPLHVSVKDDTMFFDQWTGKVGDGQAKQLPIGGMTGDGTETVTLKFNGKRHVKSIKATVVGPIYTMAKDATAKDKGKLICTDGHIHAFGEDAECTADRVAMIVYIGTTFHNTYTRGLALALADESERKTWPQALTACKGYKNENTPVTGAEWLLAIKEQWENMMGSNGANGYANLRDGFSRVGGKNLMHNQYWSGTPNGGAQCFNFFNGSWDGDNQSNTHYVRACLMF